MIVANTFLLLFLSCFIVAFAQEHKQCNCEDVDEPECGSDAVTYSNKCERKCRSVPKASDGPCPEGGSSKPVQPHGRRMAAVQTTDGRSKPVEPQGRRMAAVQKSESSTKQVEQGGRRMKPEKKIGSRPNEDMPEERIQGRSFNNDDQMDCERIKEEYFGRCSGGSGSGGGGGGSGGGGSGGGGSGGGGSGGGGSGGGGSGGGGSGGGGSGGGGSGGGGSGGGGSGGGGSGGGGSGGGGSGGGGSGGGGNCGCPKKYRPECGKDGKTYTNKCLRECEGAVKLHGGECQYSYAWKHPEYNDFKHCNCSKGHEPTCGVDGMTYNNPCVRECEGVKEQYKGPCRSDGPPHCGCSLIYKPECAKDGRTYSNKCLRECIGADKQNDGPCKDSFANGAGADLKYCTCGRNHYPSCGENGMTYNNDCVMNCREGSQMIHYGPCSQKEATDLANKKCSCSKNYQPVCGNDGHNYYNKCFAECKGMALKNGERC